MHCAVITHYHPLGTCGPGFSGHSSSAIAVLFLKGTTYKTPGGLEAQIDFEVSRVLRFYFETIFLEN